ncbi:MAG TPA: cell division protein ZipA C-terminal FtsZ-binding domain-containing protein [Burkholderiales bacterium]|nr:cell division protein ZipA C-terminal FtsZ-binding domain-containing protein [Burkholderiales bacterium]
MSDLQIGLLMLGVVVVAGVLGFNWYQERQFRRRAEQTFAGGHEDILFGHRTKQAPATVRAPDSLEEVRIEPHITPQIDTPGDDAAAGGLPLTTGLPEPEIDYIVEIRAGEIVPSEKLAQLRRTLATLGRTITFSGLDFRSKSWQALTLGGAGYTSVRAALQLVDRSGPVNIEHLQRFGDAVRAAAREIAAIAELPEFAPALEQAAELDSFCGDVDMMVGINVVARSGQLFHGTKIRALAEAAGLQLQLTGSFRCMDDHGGALFSLDNQEPEPFLIDKIRSLTTPAITFVLDVPRVSDGLRAFDRMVAMGRTFADSLDGTLADDNRVPLNDAGLDKIRSQLRGIYGDMEQRGIPAGGPLALRLFS